jgi:hypothetical protein
VRRIDVCLRRRARWEDGVGDVSVSDSDGVKVFDTVGGVGGGGGNIGGDVGGDLAEVVSALFVLYIILGPLCTPEWCE